jgi:hypothetical protein
MTTSSKVFYAKQADTAPAIEEKLYDAAGAVIPLTGATVRFHLIRMSDGATILNKPATVVSVATAHVKYQWATGDLALAGRWEREWECTLADGRIITVPNDRLGYDVKVARQVA